MFPPHSHSSPRSDSSRPLASREHGLKNQLQPTFHTIAKASWRLPFSHLWSVSVKEKWHRQPDSSPSSTQDWKTLPVWWPEIASLSRSPTAPVLPRGVQGIVLAPLWPDLQSIPLPGVSSPDETGTTPTLMGKWMNNEEIIQWRSGWGTLYCLPEWPHQSACQLKRTPWSFSSGHPLAWKQSS